jgi:PEGA domain
VPIRVDSGAHHVVATLDSGERREANVEANAKQLSRVDLTFGAALPVAPGAAPAQGLLRIRCAEAGLRVVVDNQPLGVTPLASALTLAPGNYRVRFVRGPLAGAEQQVSLLAQAKVELACAAPTLVPPLGSPNEPRPNAEHHRMQKTPAYVVGAAGVALTGAAAAHFLWNRARYQDWQSRYNTYYRDPTEQNRQSANTLAQSISNASPVTLGLAVAAGVAFGTSAVLLLTRSDSLAATGGARGGGPFMTLQGAF